MLPVISPLEHPFVTIQLVGHSCAIDLHAGREHNELEPLRYLKKQITVIFPEGNKVKNVKKTYNFKEEINVRPFMHEKSDWMTINCHL